MKFRRQHPYLNYVLDFVCLERKLVVEIDGSQQLHSERDAGRDRALTSAGFSVLRFWNNEVLSQTDAVMERILANLRVNPIPTPAPPLEGEGK